MLFVSGISMRKEYESKIDYNEQFIYCSNLTSTLDVVMMFELSKKPIAFIGKKSLSKMPLFGYYYKSTNVLVDRSNLRNAYAAYQKAGEKINAGQNMAIYPEGGIPNENIRLAKFKNGPFKLAIEQKVKKYDHLCKMTIHGMLHLLGYDHNTEKQFKRMNKFENIIFDNIKHLS